MWLAMLLCGILFLFNQNRAAAVEIFVPDPTQPIEIIELQDAPDIPANPLPVLFVHGHNSEDADDGGDLDANGTGTPNFKKNWINPLNGLQSFHSTIYSPLNTQLGIEPYYIRFRNQERDIRIDAAEIGEAITMILQRHDPNFDPTDAQSTHVKVVIIGYSKGTISARYYLKQLYDPDTDFKPVSEFIAIAPPNHGLAIPYPILPNLPALSNQQLNNGYNGRGLLTNLCLDFNNSASANFIWDLNGHDMAVAHATAVDANGELVQIYPDEAPGSRELGESPLEGVLYVTLYATNNADMVGGHHPPGSPNNTGEADCDEIDGNDQLKQGRVVAKNLAPDAINIQIANIPGSGKIQVHQNTVHFSEVICQALYTAVHHRTPPSSSGACTVIDGIPQIPLPPRASVILALDRSGSMSQPACPGCESRMEILKDAVDLFVDLWTIVGVPTDQLGVTYFSTAASEFACNDTVAPNCRVIDISQATMNDRGLLPLLQNAAAIKQSVNTQNAAGTTAMGKGLLNAIQRLETQTMPATEETRIILFTDGMQNVSPFVVAIPEGCPQPACQYEIASSPPKQLNQNLNISIDTIGIGSSDSFLNLLDAISDKTDGFSNTTLDPQNDLRQFFIESLINALRGFSPQIIDYRRSVMKNDEITEAFSINRSVDKVIFKLSWPRGHQLNFSVEKDGADVTSVGQITPHRAYRIFSIIFPTALNGQPIEPAGEWSLRIRGTAGTPYQAAAIVDQPGLSYTTSMGTNPYVVGDRLSLQVNLFRDGQPLPASAKVKAAIYKPQKALGSLLAETPEPDTPAGVTLEPNATIGQRKLQFLMLDEEFRKQLEPAMDCITLEHQGDGKYTAQTPPVAIPGIYRAVFDIQGDDPEIGSFRRSETRSTHVNFAQADVEMTPVTLQTRNTITGREATLTLRPRDSHGNFLGPDYGQYIQVIPTITGFSGKTVQDHGDGNYSQTFAIPADTDPKVTISILGMMFFHGDLSEIETTPSRRPWVIWVVLLLLVAVSLIIFRYLKKSQAYHNS
jgi:hypothetical protein